MSGDGGADAIGDIKGQLGKIVGLLEGFDKRLTKAELARADAYKRFDEIKSTQQDMNHRLEGLEKTVADNADITKQLRPVYTFGKWLIGGGLLVVAATWEKIAAWWGGS